MDGLPGTGSDSGPEAVEDDDAERAGDRRDRAGGGDEAHNEKEAGGRKGAGGPEEADGEKEADRPSGGGQEADGSGEEALDQAGDGRGVSRTWP